MTEPGYVYALINYSMPGLLKIGRTSRAPPDRGQELSAASGVPTPFVLLFDIFVPDSVAAERLIHEALEHAGFRHAQGREFFSVPPDLAIRLMLGIRDGADAPSVRLPRRLDTDPLVQLPEAAAEAVLRLIALGYRSETAAELVTEVSALNPSDDVQGWVTKALTSLAKK